MPKKLKLTRNELHRLQKELASAVLREQGHGASEIAGFHEIVENLGIQEIYRPIILEAFLGERREELGGREPSILFNSRDETPGELLAGKRKETLAVVPTDLKSYIITTLILISKDSPETLLPARKALFQAMKRPVGSEASEDEVKAIALTPAGREEESEEEEPEEEDEDSGEKEPPAPDHWEQMGQQLTRENLSKCTRYPPVGFEVKKLGRGWLFTRGGDEAQETMSLPELFVQLATPLLVSRMENLHREQDELRKELQERKAENKRLLEKIEGLKEQLGKLKQDKLRVDRTSRTLRKSNKQMRRRMKTSKDENDYEHMYG